MIFLYLFLLILFIFDCRIRVGKNDSYFDKNELSPIKGFFVILVYFSHFIQYLEPAQKGNIFDSLFITIVGISGQLIVTMFFVYSGYGLFYKINENKDRYLSSFIRKRVFPVYLDFFVCILIYIAYNIYERQFLSFTVILQAFLGWTSIGNSNWFMFDTFVSYLLLYVVFKAIKDMKMALIVDTLLTVCFIFVLSLYRENYWWNTIICLPLGMWIFYYKNIFDRINKSNKIYLFCGSFLVVLFIIFFILQRKLPYIYPFFAIVFSLMVVLVQMRFNFINSKFFAFLGSHVFSIYMLQRIVLILLGKLKIAQIPIIYCISGFLITVIFSVFFDLLMYRARRLFIDEKI